MKCVAVRFVGHHSAEAAGRPQGPIVWSDRSPEINAAALRHLVG